MVSSRQGQSRTTVDMKADPALVDERKANLPLPDQPGGVPDFKSLDARISNIDSGAIEAGISAGSDSLREPATGDASGAAREAKDGLSGNPNDAVTRDQKDHTGLEQTTGKDY